MEQANYRKNRIAELEREAKEKDAWIRTELDLDKESVELLLASASRIAELEADKTKLFDQLVSLQFAASTYIRTHKNQRVRFQDADDAELYTEAGKELEEILHKQVMDAVRDAEEAIAETPAEKE